MSRLTENKKFQGLFHIWVQFVFIFAHIIPLPFLLVKELFLSHEKRHPLWRHAAMRTNRIVFKLAGITLSIPHNLPDPAAEPRIFISNHPTVMDGFIYFSFLGPEIIPLSAPTDRLMFPFNIWFRKMGIIDVQRDEYDHAVSKKANNKKIALEKLIKTLTVHKKSVLIFPEGHVEPLKHLHYIHTGAARVSIRANVPIVPLSLINLDLIVVDHAHEKPGHVYVKWHPPLIPPIVSKKLPFRHAVKTFSKDIANVIQNLIPSRNVPCDMHDANPARIGVFIDIDRTLYKGYSQKDFIKYLMNRNKLSHRTTARIFYYLALEKLHIIAHQELMRRAYSFTKGINEKDMNQWAERFFKTSVIPHLVHDMIANIKDHQKQGHTIILISEVIKPLARQFERHFKAVDVACTVIVRHNGTYTGNIKRLCTGEEKATQLRAMATKHSLDLKKSYAYGDSAADIPMMHLVRHKIAVSPKPELRHEALLHNWNIL